MIRNVGAFRAAIIVLGSFAFSSGLQSTAWGQSSSEGDETGAGDGISVYLEGISIVTTRRFEEDIQSTPMSVEAFDSEDLRPAGRSNVEQAVEAIPNAVFWSQGSISAPQITIRGVGGLGGNAGVDRKQGVGFFIDEVFVARPAGYPSFFWDTERFEIARGAQVVLYGRNSIGGAANVITEKPGDTYSGIGRVSFGEYGLKRFSGGVTTPISNQASVRSSITYTDRDGIVFNEFDGSRFGEIDNIAGRIVADLRPSDRTLLRFSVDYGEDDTDGFIFGKVDEILDRRINQNEKPVEKREVGGVMARLEHEFDVVQLTSITAYRGFDYEIQMDGDFGPDPLFSQGQFQEQRQFTQEVRLRGDLSDQVSWMLGGFYFQESLKGADRFDCFRENGTGGSCFRGLGNGPRIAFEDQSFNSLDQNTKSYSAFGELGYAATDQFEIIGGLRYTFETVEGTAEVGSPSGTGAFGSPKFGRNSEDFNSVNPEVILRYRPTDTAMTYARVSNGFRAGGVSQFINDGEASVYDSETVWAYEVGAKTQWFNRALTLNVAIFYNDYKDLQVLQRLFPGRRIDNADAAETYGFEVEGNVVLSEYLNFRFGYGYLHAQYTDYTDEVGMVVYDGNYIPLSPKNSFNAGLHFEAPVFQSWNIFADINYNYKSPYYFNANNEFEQDETHIVNASLGLGNGTWSAEVWCKNLTDERYVTGYFRNGADDLASPADPRTFGATLTGRF